jgi:hypothetical protein
MKLAAHLHLVPSSRTVEIQLHSPILLHDVVHNYLTRGTTLPYLPSMGEYKQMEVIKCRSQWPRGLRHELSSLARTLGSWVRIPLEAWMSVCVYSVFVLFCV